MNTIKNVLVVDTCPFVMEAYEETFVQVLLKNIHFNIIKIQRSDDLETMIINKRILIDLVLLDLDLPPSTDGKYRSGVEVAIDLKKRFCELKIIAFTIYKSNYKLYHIFKNINPDGFLIKSEFTKCELLKAIKEILSGEAYYSRIVVRLLRKNMSCQFVLDPTDREILYLLSKGLKMKDLPQKINLSLAGIERRKRHLKEAFNVERQRDGALIEVAKLKGFI